MAGGSNVSRHFLSLSQNVLFRHLLHSREFFFRDGRTTVILLQIYSVLRPKVNRYLGIVLSVFALIFSAWMAWVFFINFGNSDPSIKAGLIGLFGVFSAGIITHYQTKKREIKYCIYNVCIHHIHLQCLLNEMVSPILRW